MIPSSSESSGGGSGTSPPKPEDAEAPGTEARLADDHGASPGPVGRSSATAASKAPAPARDRSKALASRPNVVFSLGLLGIAAVFILDVTTAEEIRLHLFYLFPFALIAVECASTWQVNLAFAITTALQITSFVLNRPSAAALVTDALISISSSILVLLFAKRVKGQLREIQEAAEARLRAIEEVRHADRLATVGKLASGFAHELGTPLNVILGRAKMIHGDERALRNAKTIAEQAERMTRIVRRMLDFARRKAPTHGQAPADMRALARQTVELLTPLARKNQVQVKVEADDGLPPLVRMDAEAIHQALSNLVMNGIQAMPKGGELTVHLSLEDIAPPGVPNHHHQAFACIRVTDTGTGIEPQALQRVFEPFFTTKEVGEGTGLGLSVVHGIVADHGGFVTVDSQVRHGSTFAMFLPVESPPQQGSVV